MNPEEVQQILSFRSTPVVMDLAVGNIDLEAGIIRDVVMVEEGDAQGHMVSLEAEFINDLVAFDLSTYGDVGVKSRFGHPRFGDEMGTQLGRYKNIRSRKKGGKMQAIGDYHLLQASKSSPKGNLFQFVLDMAQEAPDFMMASIEFRAGRYYQKEKGGTKKYVWEYQKATDGAGDEYLRWVSSDPKLGKVYVEFGDKGEHYYTDMVEAGAATKSLFQAAPPAPETPKIKPPIKMDFMKLFFGKDKPTEDVIMSPAEIEDMRTKMGAAEAAINDVKTKLTAAEASVTSLQAEVANYKTEVADLKTKLGTKDAEIVALNAKIPAAEATKGAGEGDSGQAPGNTQSWMKSPIMQKVASMQKSK